MLWLCYSSVFHGTKRLGEAGEVTVSPRKKELKNSQVGQKTVPNSVEK